MSASWFKRVQNGDDGMTIVEVMISAAIFFIVLTAVLGLTMQSTNMGMQAKQNSVLTNVVNSYIERVQALNFEYVEVGTDPNVLPSSETTTVGEYTIVIVPTVSPGDVEGLKELHVEATLTTSNGRVQTTATTVIIRDKTRFLTQGVRSPETDPVVEFQSLVMPALNEVVWGSQRAGGGVLRIAATASASEGRTLDSVVVRADSGWPLRDTNEVLAAWTPGTQEWTMPYFIWNTLQEEIVDIDTGDTDWVIRDGVRTITIAVSDSEGVETSSIWTLLVDNNNPDAPATVGASNTALNKSTVTWAQAMDGTTPAYQYGVLVRRQSPSDAGSWTEVLNDTVAGSTLSVVMDTVPFSRYFAHVLSISPKPLYSGYTEVTSSLISPPHAYGSTTVVVKYAGNSSNAQSYTTTTILGVDPPQFSAEEVTYKWCQATSPSGPWTQIGTGANLTKSYDAMLPAPVYYYRCFVSFTPGEDHNGQVSPRVVDYPSTVIGPTGTASATLTERWVQ
jgi:type II secretory pathway pseudopilin PulG